jgi:uroporphyrinogen decarboxylase
MAQAGADVIGLDWTMSLKRARQQLHTLQQPIALQGNIDPLALFAEPAQIQQLAIEILNELATAPPMRSGLHALDGHIFNLGHGISQFTPPEHVTALVEAVISRSQALRK